MRIFHMCHPEADLFVVVDGGHISTGFVTPDGAEGWALERRQSDSLARIEAKVAAGVFVELVS